MPDTALHVAHKFSSKSDVVLGVALAILSSVFIGASALATYNTRCARFVTQDALAVALGFASGALLNCVLDQLLPAAQRSFEVFAKTEDDLWINPAHASASFMCACSFATGFVLVWALDSLSQCFAAAHLARSHRTMRCDDLGESINAEVRSADIFRSKIEDDPSTDMLHNLVIASGGPLTSSSEMHHVGIAKIVQFTVANSFVGAAMSVATMQTQTLGVAMAVAVVLFNGAVTMALAQFMAKVSGMRWRAVLCCVVSSFSLPFGGSIASYVAVMGTPAPFVIGALLSGVGGMLAGSCLAQVLLACFTNAPDQASRISASILAGIATQAVIRAILDLAAA